MIVADPESNIRNGDVGHGNNLSPCTQQTCQKGVLSSFADFLQYVKIKSLSAQPSESMVVGVSPMGS